MSTENVKLIGRMQPPPDQNLVRLYNDESTVNVLIDAMAPSFDPAVESRYFDVEGKESKHSGLDGLRETWQQWVGPWRSFRSEAHKVLPLGDQVLVVTEDFGVSKDTEIPEDPEQQPESTRSQGASIWTVKAGMITAVDVYANRQQALASVGLVGKPKKPGS